MYQISIMGVGEKEKTVDQISIVSRFPRKRDEMDQNKSMFYPDLREKYEIEAKIMCIVLMFYTP